MMDTNQDTPAENWFRRIANHLNFAAAFNRFLIPSVLVSLLSVMVSLHSYFDVITSDTLERMLVVTLYGAAGGVLVRLAVEAFRTSDLWAIIGGLVFVALGAWFAFRSDQVPEIEPQYHFLAAIGLFLLWGLVAFVVRRADTISAWMFHTRVIIGGVLVIAAGGMAALGMLSVDFALDALFGFDDDDFMVEVLIPIVLIGLTPLAFFVTIPKVSDLPTTVGPDDRLNQRVLTLIAKIVGVPLIVVFTAILYAYAAKIGIDQAWPVNQVGPLVLYFGGAGTVVWLALYPSRQDDRIAGLYCRFWPWLALLPLGLLSIAIYIRIDAYGLTVERVFVIGAALWLWLSSFALLARPSNPSVNVIPGLAGAILLVLVISPISALNLGLNAQVAAVDRLLDRLDGNDFGALANEITETERRDIQGRLRTIRGLDPEFTGLSGRLNQLGYSEWAANRSEQRATGFAFLTDQLDLNRRRTVNNMTPDDVLGLGLRRSGPAWFQLDETTRIVVSIELNERLRATLTDRVIWIEEAVMHIGDKATDDPPSNPRVRVDLNAYGLSLAAQTGNDQERRQVPERQFTLVRSDDRHEWTIIFEQLRVHTITRANRDAAAVEEQQRLSASATLTIIERELAAGAQERSLNGDLHAD